MRDVTKNFMSIETESIEGLEPIDVFLDTSVFVGLNYSYTNHLFVALRDRVNQGRARLIMPTSTIEEVKVRIKKDIEASAQFIKKTRDNARVLRNVRSVNFAILFDDIDDTEALTNELTVAFETFLTDLNTEIVNVEDANTRQVFNLYFSGAPPFGSGKKKFEFPDAFALSALNEWATDCKVKLHVVSGDNDMQGIEKSFPNLVLVQTLEKFLNSVSFVFDELAPVAKKLLDENMEEIKRLLADDFGGLGFALADQDGDAFDIKVLEVDEPAEYLISLKPGKDDKPAEAQFELTAGVQYSAAVSYKNLDTATYDNEDKVLIPWEKVEKRVKASEIFRAHLHFAFYANEPHDFEIQELRIMDLKDIYVPTTEDDEWPYK